MKEVIKPTYEELQQRVKDLELELEGRPELTFHPTPRVNSLRDYIDDPTPTNMFKCGQEYEYLIYSYFQYHILKHLILVQKTR